MMKILIYFMYYDKFIIKINRIDNKSIISVYNYDKLTNLIISFIENISCTIKN
jgi:hypothetical protein